MGAVALENREHLGPMIEPELAVTLAEGHRLGPDLELGIADPRQHRLVEARRDVEIAHRDGDMVDHGTRSDSPGLMVRSAAEPRVSNTQVGCSRLACSTMPISGIPE